MRMFPRSINMVEPHENERSHRTDIRLQGATKTCMTHNGYLKTRAMCDRYVSDEGMAYTKDQQLP